VSIRATSAIDIHDIPNFRSKPRTKDFAVIIGIEDYRSLPKSDYSRSDAGIVKDYLKALGFQEKNITLLLDDKASLSDIKKSIEAWLPNRVQKGSSVLIYYSGHGAPEPNTGNAYIVPYDGDPSYLQDTGYSLARLYEIMGQLQASEIFVILDSCFSGAGGRSVIAKGVRPLVMTVDKFSLPTNTVLFTSTQGSKISTSSPEKGHGIFTYYFLKAIKDGKRSISEIFEHIKPQVEDESKLFNIQQSPSLTPPPDKLVGRFILRK